MSPTAAPPTQEFILANVRADIWSNLAQLAAEEPPTEVLTVVGVVGRGADIATVQRLAEHADVSTTARDG